VKIAIAGQGAIASLFTYYWRDYSPTILLKQLPAESNNLILNKDTLFKSTGPLDDIHCPHNTDFDYLIIALKSYHIDSLIACVRPWLRQTTTLVLVQNGMGNAERLHKAFDANPLLVGTTTDAVYRSAEHSFKVTAFGQLDIGVWRANNGAESADASAEMERKQYIELNAHPDLVWHPDIRVALLRKLAINAVINPLSAIFNVKNGELPRFSEELNRLKSEVCQLYLQTLNPAWTIQDGPLSQGALGTAINTVIQKTANNYSSMHQDLYSVGAGDLRRTLPQTPRRTLPQTPRRTLPQTPRRTEIDAVLGYLLNLGKQSAIELPFMETVYHKIIRLQTTLAD